MLEDVAAETAKAMKNLEILSGEGPFPSFGLVARDLSICGVRERLHHVRTVRSGASTNECERRLQEEWAPGKFALYQTFCFPRLRRRGTLPEQERLDLPTRQRLQTNVRTLLLEEVMPALRASKPSE